MQTEAFGMQGTQPVYLPSQTCPLPCPETIQVHLGCQRGQRQDRDDGAGPRAAGGGGGTVLQGPLQDQLLRAICAAGADAWLAIGLTSPQCCRCGCVGGSFWLISSASLSH